MATFSVDDDVVALVWRLAQPAPFENLSFSEALRRILSHARSAEPSSPGPKAVKQPEIAPLVPATGGRVQKTSIRSLVRLGLLKNGETVQFRDFRGTIYPTDEATISGDSLVYSDGRHYSMSFLAGKLLQKYGYKGDSVRGPIHWVTSSGRSIWDLWEQAITTAIEAPTPASPRPSPFEQLANAEHDSNRN
jgi:hypothetical protein